MRSPRLMGFFFQALGGTKRKQDGRIRASVERGEQREQVCKNVRTRGRRARPGASAATAPQARSFHIACSGGGEAALADVKAAVCLSNNRWITGGGSSIASRSGWWEDGGEEKDGRVTRKTTSRSPVGTCRAPRSGRI